MDAQELIAQLREYASNTGYSHNDYADTMREAADMLAERAVSPAESVNPSESRESCCEHDSDCAVHNAPAYPPGPCDCSVLQQEGGKEEREFVARDSDLQALLDAAVDYIKGVRQNMDTVLYMHSLFERVEARLATTSTSDNLQQASAAQAEPDKECGDCFEGKSDMGHTCRTCNGVGLIGGPVCQTPESFDYVGEDCPDCTQSKAAQKGAQDLRHDFEIWKSRRGEAAIYAGDGQYESSIVQGEWEAWCDSAELYRAAPPQQVEDDTSGLPG